MTIYNFIYFLVWLISIFSYSKGFNNEVLYRIQTLLLLFFSAVRFQTGYDWPVYQDYYYSINPIDFEVGFSLLVKLFNYVGLGFNSFVFFSSVVQVLLITRAIRYFFPKHGVLILAIMYSISDFYLIPMFSLIRQSLAVSIFLYGMMLYHKGFNNKAKVFFLVSCLFHLSTIPAILITYAFYKTTINRRIFLVVFIISLIAYLTSINLIGLFIKVILPYIGNKYEIYTQRDTYNASNLYRTVFGGVSCLVFLLVYRYGEPKFFKKGDHNTVFVCALFAVIIPLLFYSYPTISTRYQYFYSIFMIGVCLNAFCYIKQTQKLMVLILLCFLFYIPFYRFLTNPLSIVYVPYQNMITYDNSNSTGQERTEELISQLSQLWSDK